MQWDGQKLRPIWDGEPYARELYSHLGPAFPLSFDATENINLAGNTSYGDVVSSLSAQLRQLVDRTGSDRADAIVI